jgi:dTDP-4-amino-4,6-dideoxygalactose transaminase
VVICSTFTFVATANAVTYVGAELVFVDSEAESWNMSPVLLADAFARVIAAGRRVGAVIMVDLYGQCADADPIRAICAGHSVPLIEDAAEALGATYRGRPAGTLGDLGVLSFNGNKIITTSGGGMLVAPEVATTDRVRYLATQAREPVSHYEHLEVGFNYRMSNLLAAVGAAQLSRLDEIMQRRRAINERYRALLGNRVEFMPQPEWSEPNTWLTCVLLADQAGRDRLIEALAGCSIEARPLWKPMHLQPVYKDALAVTDGTSDGLFERGVCLPSSGALTDDEVDQVLEVVTGCVA